MEQPGPSGPVALSLSAHPIRMFPFESAIVTQQTGRASNWPLGPPRRRPSMSAVCRGHMQLDFLGISFDVYNCCSERERVPAHLHSSAMIQPALSRPTHSLRDDKRTASILSACPMTPIVECIIGFILVILAMALFLHSY
jgi:hypothetical protein